MVLTSNKQQRMTQHLLEKASVSAELKEPYFEANILLIGLQI